VRRTVGRLTPKQVQHAKPKNDRRVALLADGGNLYLQCTRGKDDAVSRSWVFRYELDGARREMGLGPLHTLGLSDARDKAKSLRQQLLDAIDPLEAKRQAKMARLAEQAKTVTFKNCAEMYLKSHQDEWKNAKHRAQWTSTLETYVYPIMGDLSVSDIDTNLVIKIVEPIWKRIPETASRVRGRIEAVLGYATVRAFRTGDNPARWRGHLAEVLCGRSEVEHHAALPYAEMPAFMAKLHDRQSTSGRALEFTILTAVRTSEAVGATWSEIDIKAKTWTIPASRMKAGKEHKVPLSDRVIAILKGLPRHGDQVFAGADNRPLSNMAMLQLLRGMRPGLTVHGFRSAFRDWSAEMTSYPNHVVEKALAHAVADKVEAAYRRGDLFEKRRKLMAAWSEYCAKPLPAGATVTPLRKVAANA
jgi:integrase